MHVPFTRAESRRTEGAELLALVRVVEEEQVEARVAGGHLRGQLVRRDALRLDQVDLLLVEIERL